jgi:hypothetical protein
MRLRFWTWASTTGSAAGLKKPLSRLMKLEPCVYARWITSQYASS